MLGMSKTNVPFSIFIDGISVTAENLTKHITKVKRHSFVSIYRKIIRNIPF